jgi:hypothetical protein
MEGIKMMRKVVAKLINPQTAHILPKIFLHTSLNEAGFCGEE